MKISFFLPLSKELESFRVKTFKNIFISRETEIDPTFPASPINNYKHETMKTCRGIFKKKYQEKSCLLSK